METNITDEVDRLLARNRDRFLVVPLPDTGPEDRHDLAQYLRDEGWPAAPITAHAVGLFATAVRRKYEDVHGHQPPWSRGWVYEGFADWLLIHDVYEEQMGAIAEQLAHEGMTES